MQIEKLKKILIIAVLSMGFVLSFSQTTKAASVQSCTEAGKIIAKAEKEAYKKKKNVTTTVRIKVTKTSNDDLERAVTKAELGAAYHETPLTISAIGGFTGGMYFQNVAIENYHYDNPPNYGPVITPSGKWELDMEGICKGSISEKNGIETYKITILGNKKNFRNAYYRNLCLRENIENLLKEVKGMEQKEMAATVAEWIATRRPFQPSKEFLTAIGETATEYEDIRDGYGGSWGVGRDCDILLKNKNLNITGYGLDSRLYLTYAKLAGVKKMGVVFGKNIHLTAYVQCGNKKYAINLYERASYKATKKQKKENLKKLKVNLQKEIEQNEADFQTELEEAIENYEIFDLPQNEDFNGNFVVDNFSTYLCSAEPVRETDGTISLRNFKVLDKDIYKESGTRIEDISYEECSSLKEQSDITEKTRNVLTSVFKDNSIRDFMDEKETELSSYYHGEYLYNDTDTFPYTFCIRKKENNNVIYIEYHLRNRELTEEEIDGLRTSYKQKAEEELSKKLEEKNQKTTDSYEAKIKKIETWLKEKSLTDYWLETFPKSGLVYKR